MKRGKGKVYLIGAGPGDPGLITVRGLKKLREADVVLYDHLVNPALLSEAAEKTRLICVGKRRGHGGGRQSLIHRILLRESRKGKTVARLKGGDPYIFGRGAEEGKFLNRHRIDYEVIPGLTSGIAGASYAGVPLTERTLGSSVAFVTGHHAAGAGKKPDWKALLSAAETIVIYMGMARIRRIVDDLIRAGCPPHKPAAVVQWATWPRQLTRAGLLRELPRKIAAARMNGPAVMIVGDVVRLRKPLAWFERLPLFGRTVAVTRAESQSSGLREKLETLGARVVEIPALLIRPPAGKKGIDAAVKKARSFDWIVFTSANGVESFFGRLAELGRDARALGGAQIAAVGPATAERLLKYGVRSDFQPRRYTTARLFEEWVAAFGSPRGKKFLLLRSQIAAPDLPRRLKAAGAEVTQVAAYRTLAPKAGIRRAVRAARRETLDAVTFTSASTAHHLAAALSRASLKKFFRKTRAVSIGPVTTAALKSHGIRPAGEARRCTTDGLVETVRRILAR